MNTTTARVVDVIRNAAICGKRAPSNSDLAAAVGIQSASAIVRHIQAAESCGAIIVHRGNCTRIIAASDGTWATAGEVTNKHWRVRSEAERGTTKKPSKPRAPRKTPHYQNSAASLAKAQRAGPKPVFVAPEMPKPRPIPRLNAAGCLWPMWGHQERPSRVYCEAPREGGHPYCGTHCRAAYTPRVTA